MIIPFTKKTPIQDKTTKSTSQLFPTSVETNPSPATANVTPVTIKANFTGALEEQIPQPIIDLAAQKKDLKSKVPLSLSTFSVDFNYGTDKFEVALHDPKDQAKKEFESWRGANYPGLGVDQFQFK